MGKMHHKVLRIIPHSCASYHNLLECNNNISICQRYLRFSVTEVYKGTLYTNSRFMWSFFRKQQVPYVMLWVLCISYNLRKGAVRKAFPSSCKVAHFRSTLICNQLPSSIKFSKLIAEFETNLKKLWNIDSGWAICRKYLLIVRIVFIYSFFFTIILVTFFFDKIFLYLLVVLLAFAKIVLT